ncbi:MAG: lamin tail domain-containing protein [Anaerolineae bacterium]|nr:lamin tail domain-containing protein [Anaerolineae bacterium]
MSLRRTLPFLLLNVVVSLAVILGVLYLWDRRAPVEPATTPLAPLGESEGTPAPLVPVAASDGLSSPAAPELASEEEAPEQETEEEGPTVHIVQAGDTLGRISELYEVELDDIVAANGIVNINALSIGQELIIPIGGLATPTLLPTLEPTAAVPPTPRPTEPLPSGTAIVEISEVIGVTDLATEAVRITNAGTRPVALRDWKLADEHGNIFTFGDVTLFGSSTAGNPSILVHTEAGRNGPSDLYWGQESAVWEPGETVTLFDAEDTVQATYQIP